jgi:chemotaxis protein methyltransferase CheR
MGARDGFTETLVAAGDGALREYAFSPADFERVRRMIHARAGINLNETKQNMVYSRLSRRLRATGHEAFSVYLDRMDADSAFAATEEQQFINALTTNLTSFYRENHHFPALAEFLSAHGGAPRLWCSAASTGEEPYTIAMTMLEALGSGTQARLLATDIDTNVLQAAARAVYRMESVRACGDERLRRFFLRGSAANAGMARVKPEVSRLVEFAALNLLEPAWPALRQFAPKLDVIFCRNVMIYFDKATQRQVLARFAEALRPGGLLFVGHSENFTDCRDWFVLRGKTIYERV